MKNLTVSAIALGTTVLIAGCASPNHQALVLDPVGPSAMRPAARGAEGSLVVFSAYEAHANFSDTSPYQRHYTDYKVLSTSGQLVQAVHNDPSNLFDGPATVKLPAGSYRVIAQSNGYGEVTVPVLVAGGQTTVVHLEGGGNQWPDRAALTAANPVRLPDGRIVGWRAVAQADNQ